MANKILSVLSLNTGGLATKAKRHRTMAALKLSGHDIILLQETHIFDDAIAQACRAEWEGTSVWCLGMPQSCGVAVLFKIGLTVKINKIVSHPGGRLLEVQCEVDDQAYHLINVYCPNNSKERNIFLHNLTSIVVGGCAGTLILGGDFNSVEDTTLDKIYAEKPKRFRAYSKKALINLRQTCQLIDTYRYIHPQGLDTTYHSISNNVKSRIDRVLVPISQEHNIISAGMTSIVGCDHRGVITKLKTDALTHGKGHWKCNTVVLRDPHFREDMEALWKALLSEAGENELSLEWWDDCKIRFKYLAVSHSIRIANNRRTNYNVLIKQLNKYKEKEDSDPSTFQPLITHIEAEIKTLLDNVCEGARIRAKALHIENTDKAVSFFLRTEKSHGKAKTINSLKVGDKLITDQNKIISECREFYNNLLTAQPVDKSAWAQLADSLPSLSPDDSASCEGDLTYEECWEAIRAMENNKSPGCDGFPAEFYKLYFHLFGDVFVKIINNNKGSLSFTQRVGLITLLCKDPLHADELGNWRPISLLNVDYKIISKSMVNRLKTVAHNIIGPEQSCGIPKRTIFDNLHFLRNTFDYCKERSLTCIALCFDQVKAFDRVDHEYLFFILKTMGFGPSFINWVRLLYADVYSAVIVNGFLGDLFSVSRSMRQGCGLSPLLYALTIEPLAHLIRRNLLFKGIPIPFPTHYEVRIALYADDSTVLTTDVESVNIALQIFTLYGRASGASLNLNKSVACFINGNPDLTNWPAWLQIKPAVKICGIYYGLDASKLIEEKLQARLECDINNTKGRYLTMLGRVTLLNVAILTKLWYVAACHILTPSFMKWLERLIFKYIWSNKSERIKRLTLIRPYNQGGLGVMHIKSRCTAYQVKHVQQVINNSISNGAALAKYFLAKPLLKLEPSIADDSPSHAGQPSPFYKTCIMQYKKFRKSHLGPMHTDAIVKNVYAEIISKISISPTVLNSCNPVQRMALWSSLSKLPLSPEARNLVWFISHQIVAVKAFLNHRHILADNLCPMCGAAPETIEHCLVECGDSKLIIDMVTKLVPAIVGLSASAITTLNLPSGLGPEMESCTIVISEALHFNWLQRNERVFNNKITAPFSKLKMFMGRIKARIKADHHRLSGGAFEALWLQSLLHLEIHINHNQVEIIFPP